MKLKKTLIVILACVFVFSLTNFGFAKTQFGTKKYYIEQAWAKHPELCQKLINVMQKISDLGKEVSKMNCHGCNNAAGSLRNIVVEAGSLFQTLGGNQQYTDKDKVERIYKSLNNYDDRMKVFMPNKEWFNKWIKMKDELNNLKPEILKTIK